MQRSGLLRQNTFLVFVRAPIRLFNVYLFVVGRCHCRVKSIKKPPYLFHDGSTVNPMWYSQDDYKETIT